jgi:hypothetical protein
VAAGGRSSQSRESGGAVGSCCPSLSLGRSLRAASPRRRARDPGRGAGSWRGSRRRWRGPVAGMTSSRLWPLLVVCAGSGRRPPPPSTGRCSHCRGRHRRSREPDARQRPTGRHFEASSCTRMLAVEDQGRRGAAARRDREELLQCSSHPRALLAGSRGRRVGRGSKPVWDQNETRTEFKDLVGRFASSGTGLTQRNKFKDRHHILLLKKLLYGISHQAVLSPETNLCLCSLTQLIHY